MSPSAASLRAARAPRDRLLVMLFFAAVLHGLIILGVTFDSPLAGGRGAPGLKVLLVSTQLPTAPRNDTAAYLAQRTQLGSGNTRPAVTPRIHPGRPGMPQGSSGTAPVLASAGGIRQPHPAEPVLTTRGFSWSTQVTYFPAPRDAGGAGFSGRPASLLGEGGTGPLQLNGPQRALWVSPDTRSTLVAPYLVAWRRKVERIGTLNFPLAARDARLNANPVIEVAIASDGTLARALIRRSSGDPALDQAALAILKLASPFNPFPPSLARRYSMLRFTYEWQFVGGRVRGTVTMP